MSEFIKPELTDEQHRNLLMLHTHLGRVDRISMQSFHLRYAMPQSAAGDTECCSVACLAGNGPAAGILALENEDWSSYVARVFGSDPRRSSGCLIWDWIFSPAWWTRDNSVTGGRARIMITLVYGVPANAGRQLMGIDPLCYDPATGEFRAMPTGDPGAS